MKSDFAASAPPPDPNAAEQINAEAKEADSAENEVLGQAGSGWRPGRGSRSGGSTEDNRAGPDDSMK